ncbi:hypothetical protein [Curtobacterium sp. MCBA15_004]|uniref:hypothetical protein n=1 Tax=Curtobacterium sp. MCBA15_004 TaxID=1898733 RepID=UPI00111489B1|nr:hypothetical protein [Curtobacterium sp. MCBA15_004]WIA95841.1 hypothetical protein QOL16_12050 [Curtobacterium sp. MCBA15_004]
MAQYAVTLVTTASTVIQVEADDEEAAIVAAFDQAPSAAWNWPEIGDWQLPSEMFPDVNNAGDDVQLVEP